MSFPQVLMSNWRQLNKVEETFDPLSRLFVDDGEGEGGGRQKRQIQIKNTKNYSEDRRKKWNGA